MSTIGVALVSIIRSSAFPTLLKYCHNGGSTLPPSNPVLHHRPEPCEATSRVLSEDANGAARAALGAAQHRPSDPPWVTPRRPAKG